MWNKFKSQKMENLSAKIMLYFVSVVWYYIFGPLRVINTLCCVGDFICLQNTGNHRVKMTPIVLSNDEEELNKSEKERPY